MKSRLSVERVEERTTRRHNWLNRSDVNRDPIVLFENSLRVLSKKERRQTPVSAFLPAGAALRRHDILLSR